MNLKTDFTEPECERFRRLCNFTDDELKVFNLRIRGKSIVFISIDLNMSTSTVSKRLKNIKRKVNFVLTA